MKATVIRFPVAAKLGEKPPMAKRVGLATRIKRWLFGYQRPVNRVTLFYNRVRKQA